ncbi:coagulation factor VIIi, partial [Phycodurus eques]|uniref:coagulation factor VIIi n=1 Tax=Phycodurus eques TaxID=693459 RepID=UPI002ACED95D
LYVYSVRLASVFVEKREADAVLSRWRRANSGFLEELKQGNLERECREEICDYEEAREVFEDDTQTRQFWQTYDRRDPCRVNPCHNNGVCFTVENSFQCQCTEGFEGHFCQMVFEDSLKCIYHNGQCQHFCDGSGKRRKCSCADGYILGDDGRQCIAQVEFPCGQLAPTNQSLTDQTRLVGANLCPKGECPWQVLIQLNGASHCGGTLIHPDQVVTAAHCVHTINPDKLTVVAGELNLDVDEGTEQRIPVSTVIVHEDYNIATGDSDIALLRLSEGVSLSSHALPICLPTKDLAERELLLLRYHTVSGWGKRTSGGNDHSTAPMGERTSPILRKMSVPIIQNSQCSLRSRFNFTDNMLCAGYLEGQQESCRGDDGSPLTTLYGSTHFLSGVVGWGRGCSIPGYFGVYTKVAKFVDWVESKNIASTTMSTDMLQQKVV